MYIVSRGLGGGGGPDPSTQNYWEGPPLPPPHPTNLNQILSIVHYVLLMWILDIVLEFILEGLIFFKFSCATGLNPLAHFPSVPKPRFARLLQLQINTKHNLESNFVDRNQILRKCQAKRAAGASRAWTLRAPDPSPPTPHYRLWRLKSILWCYPWPANTPRWAIVVLMLAILCDAEPTIKQRCISVCWCSVDLILKTPNSIYIFSSTWSCVSPPRPTTPSEWKSLIIVIIED